MADTSNYVLFTPGWPVTETTVSGGSGASTGVGLRPCRPRPLFAEGPAPGGPRLLYCTYGDPATRDDGVTADELVERADEAWWAGRIHEYLELAEPAYRLLVDEERPRPAAKVAMWIGVQFLARGDSATGSGWFERAGRLLAGLDPCQEHAYLRYHTVVLGGIASGDLESAAAAAREVRADGVTYSDPNLVAMGLAGEATALLRMGEVTDGLRRLDEAMLSAADESLDRVTAGAVYCHGIAECHELQDVRRLAEWTRVTWDWIDEHSPASVYPGVCRVYRSHVLTVTGEWDRAEEMAAQAVNDLAGLNIFVQAEAHYLLGELHRLRGQLDEAEESYGQARSLGRDPQPGRALLDLARGHVADASTALSAALAVSQAPLERARLLQAKVEVALAAGDLDAAVGACRELEQIANTFGTSGLEAAALQLRGAVALEQGHADKAIPALREACRRWNEVDARLDIGRSRLLLGRAYRALEDERTATEEFAGARDEFDRLGAAGDLRRAEKELDESERPGALSKREIDVLALVATGRTNQEVADKLVLSKRTVDRHVSNILRKLDLRSRTEAAAFAFEHRIVPPDAG